MDDYIGDMTQQAKIQTYKTTKNFRFPQFLPPKHPQNGRESAFSSLTLKILKLLYYRKY